MNFLTRQLRTLLLSAAVVVGVVWLSGCGDDNGVGGGGGGSNIVGDWLVNNFTYSATGQFVVMDTGYTRSVYSFNSSGELWFHGFVKYSEGWKETSTLSGTWRTEGSKLYTTPNTSGNGGATTFVFTYKVSNDKLTTEGDNGDVMIRTRVDLAAYRRSLGL